MFLKAFTVKENGLCCQVVSHSLHFHCCSESCECLWASQCVACNYTDQAVGLCDWSLYHLTLHCHHVRRTPKVADKLKSQPQYMMPLIILEISFNCEQRITINNSEITKINSKVFKN